MNITSKSEFKEYIFKRMGYPMMQIELDDDDNGSMDIIIDDVVQMYSERNYDDGSYLQHATIMVSAGISEYHLEGYDIESSYNIDLSSGMDGINILFTPMNNMFFQSWVIQGNYPGGGGSTGAAGYGGNVGLHLTEWEITQEYIKNMKFAFDKGYRPKWHKHREILEIIPTPRYTGYATFAFWKRQDAIALYNNITVKGLAVAYCKKLWGEICNKYQAQFPDGMSINAQSIIAIADLEIEKHENNMWKMNPDPGIFIG